MGGRGSANQGGVGPVGAVEGPTGSSGGANVVLLRDARDFCSPWVQRRGVRSEGRGVAIRRRSAWGYWLVCARKRMPGGGPRVVGVRRARPLASAPNDRTATSCHSDSREASLSLATRRASPSGVRVSRRQTDVTLGAPCVGSCEGGRLCPLRCTRVGLTPTRRSVVAPDTIELSSATRHRPVGSVVEEFQWCPLRLGVGRVVLTVRGQVPPGGHATTGTRTFSCPKDSQAPRLRASTCHQRPRGADIVTLTATGPSVHCADVRRSLSTLSCCQPG